MNEVQILLGRKNQRRIIQNTGKRINIADNNKYVVPSKPSQDAIKIYEVFKKKRHVVPFRLTAEV